MEKGTGLKINAFFASDYAGVIEGMRFKKVQIAWFGNKSAMEAVDRAEGEVFAQTVAASGQDGYYSHIIVHKDSPFQKLDDVLKCDKSLDFGIGDPNSTSGFLVPTTFIFSAKSIDPKQCFKTVRNANHEANALAVANKLVHAATNNSENLERLAKTAPEKAKEIRVIWTSPLIPSDPLVWRKDLDAGLKKKIADWLFAYGKAGCREEGPGRPAVGALQEVRQQPAAADPADGAQPGDHEAQGRREGRRGREDGEARRAARSSSPSSASRSTPARNSRRHLDFDRLPRRPVAGSLAAAVPETTPVTITVPADRPDDGPRPHRRAAAAARQHARAPGCCG